MASTKDEEVGGRRRRGNPKVSSSEKEKQREEKEQKFQADLHELVDATLGHAWVKEHGYPMLSKNQRQNLRAIQKRYDDPEEVRVISRRSMNKSLEARKKYSEETMKGEAAANSGEANIDDQPPKAAAETRKRKAPSPSEKSSVQNLDDESPESDDERPGKRAEHEVTACDDESPGFLPPHEVDPHVQAFFTARNYRNPKVLENLSSIGFRKYELWSMQGLDHAVLSARFKSLLPMDCQAPAQIECLSYAVSSASAADWNLLDT